MGKKVGTKLIWIFLISILVNSTKPVSASNSNTPENQGQAINIVRAAEVNGLQMVNKAISTLSQGWTGMSQEERQIFLRYYDPGITGGVDEEFVFEVLNNYIKIRDRLAEQFELIPLTRSNKCEMMTLYYTDFSKVYICPYILEEDDEQRIARDLVHEVAHMALVVFDRAYYYPNYSAYQKLTPRGHWTGRLPIIGAVLREIVRQDTLYHPDAYSKYAVELVKIETDETLSSPSPFEQTTDLEVKTSSDAISSDQKLLAYTSSQ